jgi:chemotaxis protein MotB
MAESESGSGEWLTTYADFITLLMTFFVLLYAMTSGVDKTKFLAIIGTFQGGNGALKYHSAIKDNIPQLKERRRQHRKKNWRAFNKMIKEHNMEKQIQFKIVPNGIYITLGGPVTFKTYSAKLKPEAGKILKVIARAIQKYSYEPLKSVKIFGNTDNRPVDQNAAKFPSNWSLGAARAISVLQFLVKSSTVPGKKFEAVTNGKYHPIASNDTEEGRRKNRRVKIYIEYDKRKTKSVKDDSLMRNLQGPSLISKPNNKNSLWRH